MKREEIDTAIAAMAQLRSLDKEHPESSVVTSGVINQFGPAIDYLADAFGSASYMDPALT